MSLSRLPQVALRRLVPALAAVPKSLDDDQLKKILDPQQQQLNASAFNKGSLPAKSEFANITSATQGIIAALAKSGAASASPMLGRLLTNLSGSQGNLSSQDLALLRAASSGSSLVESGGTSLLTTPEPASPGNNELEMAGYAPAVGSSGALDTAGIDALVSALQGTAAISTTSAVAAPSPAVRAGRRSSRVSAAKNATTPQYAAALDEHSQIDAATGSSPSALHDDIDKDESDSDGPSSISADLSAVERRKEQNRRAQKKFRQKDKVRQKEVKWRASQYEELVASNKRFKRDIDAVTRERDMYRGILERNGIALGDSDASKPAHALLPPAASAAAAASAGAIAANVTRTPSLASTATATASPMPSPTQYHSIGDMEQIAQDTFGSLPSGLSAANPAAIPLLSLFGGSFGGEAVRADPMFGVCGIPPLARTSSSVASALLDPSLIGQAGNSDDGSSAALPANANLDNAINALAAAIQGAPSAATAAPATTTAAALAASGGLWFGSSGGVSPLSDPLLIESPLMVDQHSIDTQYGGTQSTIDGQFVDPMAFIDELLSSPDYSPSMGSLPHLGGSNSLNVSRKRSYDDAMF
ncbi:hypothetical protein GGI23_001889 [Coemansia sp. RSA 2559]|nr:hypothetical protein GGI23_001889 [Coemansia sp. RSA 2559]KAJ2868718.1 hypothetical protein GGI22_000694 [Coemansia erecta]